MTSNNKPPGIPTTLFPFLAVKNGASAVEFYTTAFGAAVVARYDGQDGKLMAQLFIEGTEFWVGDEETGKGRY